MKRIRPSLPPAVLPFALLTILTGCTAGGFSNDPYYDYDRQYGHDHYGHGQYDPYRRDYYYERQRDAAQRERERIEDERRRLEAERERLEAERREREQASRPPVASAQKRPDRCPPGWRPRASGCSQKERKRGCRDMRTASGQGCVSF